MDRYAEKRYRERVFVLGGLVVSHVVFFSLVFWLSGEYEHLGSLEHPLAWVLVLLGAMGGYFMVKTFRSRQKRTVNRQLAMDHRFAGDVQYCDKCEVIMPMRAKHCKVCGVCSERFDHHCALLGVCVGRTNHAAFWTTLLVDSILLTALWILLFSTWWHRGGYFLIFGLFVSFPPTMCIIGLFVFHTWMAFSGQTTWEWSSHDKIYYLKDLDEETLPFDRGCCHNLREFFFRMHLEGYSWTVSSEIYQEGYEPPANCCNNKYYSCF
jgi:ribosomal protein L40E